MRAGLSTILQTLTPEASGVLTQSIAEAARRCHGQTTPLHVAATLLAASGGILRQACVRSHPQSSHPLQCRALELCFSVALDRLSAANPGLAATAEPPISNALMAALKRAQANQRRGCPEQQQQPLLAVKVELEQLLMSILDDPAVSRVMREASFSSIAVKAAVEQSLSSPSSSTATAAPAASVISLATASPIPSASPLHILTNRAAVSRNSYLNPRLHQHQSSNVNTALISAGGATDHPRGEEVKRVLDILSRSRKRNPVLVGDCNLDAVLREVLHRMIPSIDASSPLRNAQVLPFAKNITAAVPALDHSQITSKIRELGSSIECMISSGGRGVIVDLGDLKWLIETPSSAGSIQPPKPAIPEAGRAAVAEMGRLWKRFEESRRLWLIAVATSATYLRCQVYHPTMEMDWDLQAMPITSRSSFHNMFPRLGASSISGNSVEGLTASEGITGASAAAVPLKRPPGSSDPSSRRTTLCPVCTEGYECELAKHVADECKKCSGKSNESEGLPQWLQVAKLSSVGSTKVSAPLQCEEDWKQNTEELLQRWSDTCSQLHLNYSQMPINSRIPFSSAMSKNLSVRRPHPPSELKLTSSRSHLSHILEISQDTGAAKLPTSHPGSPVKTDLVLGSSNVSNCSLEKTQKERLSDLNGCTQNMLAGQQRAEIAGGFDIDMFKRLLKELTESVNWQQEAASAVVDVVMRCKSGNGKRRGGAMKRDTWLLLIGPDKVGKKKMANTLAELVFSTGPTVIDFGRASSAIDNDEESNLSYRGKTLMDRIVEAVRKNPFSMIVLENIDQADMLIQGRIKQAIEGGRLLDSYGREVSLGSIIFVLIADCLPEELRCSYHSFMQYEQTILDSAYGGMQLELTTGDRPGKRYPNWVCDTDQPIKIRKESAVSANLSLDLNLSVGVDADAGEGSRNSSDITTEHEYDKGRLAINGSTSSLAPELIELVDKAVTFKPVDFAQLRKSILESVPVKFRAIMGKGRAIRIDDDSLNRIVGGLWLSGTTLDDWAERTLVPSLRQLRDNLKADRDGLVVIRLSTIKGDQVPRSRSSDWLPTIVAKRSTDG
ncbi:protein SMAX1-like [Zingiber officinale]|uniref:protein SMAX1-like n=1 Tax=Zingiber officinale TaxID=94328 RepID=UPI001C4C4734|nr:protein SMAX1-like [Zingiber officinale]